MHKLHKLEGEFRVHSYTQLTMSYYSQLGKKQNFSVADGTHEMNILNTLPKPINESQTISIKLKSKLS